MFKNPIIKKYTIDAKVTAIEFEIGMRRFTSNAGYHLVFEPSSGIFTLKPKGFDTKSMVAVKGQFAEYLGKSVNFKFSPAVWVWAIFVFLLFIFLVSIFYASAYGIIVLLFFVLLWYYYSVNLNFVRFELYKLAIPDYGNNPEDKKVRYRAGMNIMDLLLKPYYFFVIGFYAILVLGSLYYAFFGKIPVRVLVEWAVYFKEKIGL
jgi:hypothetical protein